MTKQEQILNYIKEEYKKNPDPECTDLDLYELNTLCHLYFKSYRISTQNRGLRLTDSGLTILKKYFQYWQMELNEYKIKSKHLVFFENVSKCPWFLTDNLLILFDDDMIFKAKLAGDIDSLINSFY